MAFADTLKQKRGPLPTYAWLILFVVAMAGILIYRKKKAAAAGSTDNGSGTSGNNGATNLGSNTLDSLTPTAYPMPIQQGDTFTNVTVNPSTPTTPAKTTTPATTPTKAAGRVASYTIQKGDTWDSIGKKLNFAPVLLWEANGAPAGFKVPAVGTKIDTHMLLGNPGTVYANQASIVASEKALAGGK
jgi:nucleoid-associated protein YgaU